MARSAAGEQLKEVPGFGEATFVQAAGFLKIAGGDNPLDATWIHPESYEVAGRVLAKLDPPPADLADKEWPDQAPRADRQGRRGGRWPTELGVGDAAAEGHSRPVGPARTRSARRSAGRRSSSRGSSSWKTSRRAWSCRGTVLNVVDFGAFVDIGLHDSGLVHVSQLADKYVRDPHEVVAVGDTVKVWVLEVDKSRRRVSLTMIPPGTPRIAGRRHESRPAAPPPAPRAKLQPAQTPRPPRPPQKHPRPQGAGPQGPRPQQGRRPPPPPRPEYKPKRPPKPITPLTDEMRNGKAPLRSFSDLAQFFQVKHEPPPEEEPKTKGDQEQGPPEQT